MFNLSNLEFVSLIDDFGAYYLISEVSNYLFCILIVTLFTYFKWVEKKYYIFWCVYFLTPFLLNFVLFDPSYMPDQWTYMKEINLVKKEGFDEFNFSSILNLSIGDIKATRLGASSYILNFIPVFSLLSIGSLAFLNKLLAFLLFVFLSRRIETKYLVLFFIIPSFIIYSSLSLRETLILTLSSVSIVYLIEKKIILSLIFIVILTLVKLQNAPGFVVLWMLTFLFSADKSYLRLWGLTFLGIVALILSFDIYSPIINLYRMAWAVEDGLPLMFAQELEITSVFQLISLTLSETPRFLVKPYLWEISNPLQLFVGIESLILLYVLFRLIIKENFYKTKECQILLICMTTTLALYAVTVWNFGTLARYRFIAFFPYLLGIFYAKQLFSRRVNFATA
tara:strand:+ start:31161 stop:32345 length:1185 start_codon:yes stop_codon:yes gene_type:complete